MMYSNVIKKPLIRSLMYISLGFSALAAIGFQAPAQAQQSVRIVDLCGDDQECTKDYQHLKRTGYQDPNRRYDTARPHSVDYTGSARYEMFVSYATGRLYYIDESGKAMAYPIAWGAPGDKAPVGSYYITVIKENPSWTPTPSMRRKNPGLPETIAPGDPDNPLGSHALYLEEELDNGNLKPTLYRIHGTDLPRTIGTATTNGCIRTLNRYAKLLFGRIDTVGRKLKVTITNDIPPGIQDHRRQPKEYYRLVTH